MIPTVKFEIQEIVLNQEMVNVHSTAMIVSLLIHWLKVDIDVAGVNPSVDPPTTQASQSSCQVTISTYQ